MIKRILPIIAIILLSYRAVAQSDTLDLFSFSLEELMNMSVVSVSKKSERLFDAPLSATVITKEEMEKAGVLSIMEALRLAPGVIVREQNNGNYDIHIRGLDNTPPNSVFAVSTNISTLVMIDNRPIFNYLQGGIFWSALPVDLADVERIEIIRGPSSSLYGPNAVSGVINIITHKKSEKNGLSAAANLSSGTSNTQLANGRLNYKFNNRLQAALTGSYNLRGRDYSYYVVSEDKWYNSLKDMPLSPFSPTNPEYMMPNPKQALNKHTVNAYLDYSKSDDMEINVSLGKQGSEAQIMFFENYLTNFSTMQSNSYYANAKGRLKGLNMQMAYVTGRENPSLDSLSVNEYKYSVGDAFLEYELPVKGISIKPGMAYRNILYDYSDKAENTGSFVSGKNRLETYGLSARVDYIPITNLRLAGGVRFDRTTYPKQWFTSYQMASTYKLNSKNLVRAVYSKAYRSTFVLDAHMAGEWLNYDPMSDTIIKLVFTGNKKLQPIHSKMFEMGYRVMLTNHLHLDLEAYHIATEDFVSAVTMASNFEEEPVRMITTPMSVKELEAKSIQKGITLSANYVKSKFQVKPFVTIQKTSLLDYSQWNYMPDAFPDFYINDDPTTKNIYSGKGTKIDHKSTPKFYGGGYVNYMVSSKLNINLNSYWFSKQTFYHTDNLNLMYKMINPEIGIGRIDKKVLMNANIRYSPVEFLTLSLTGKNIFNNDSREYYLGDQMGRMILAGISVKY